MTFRDNGIKVLRYIHLEIVSHLVKHLFCAKKLAKQKVFVLRQWHFSTISTSSENFNYLEGSTYLAPTGSMVLFFFLCMFLGNQRFIIVIFSSVAPHRGQPAAKCHPWVATHQEIGSQLWMVWYVSMVLFYLFLNFGYWINSIWAKFILDWSIRYLISLKFSRLLSEWSLIRPQSSIWDIDVGNIKPNKKCPFMPGSLLYLMYCKTQVLVRVLFKLWLWGYLVLSCFLVGTPEKQSRVGFYLHF